MNIRKIAVLGSFAAGAALGLAPLASADPTDITSTVDSEIGSLNALFVTYADLAGDGSDVATHGANTFDTIPVADAPQTAPFTTLDYELYGVNPADAGPAGDPGSYNDFNGALTEFDNAYNVELYSLLNGGDIAPATDVFSHADFLNDGVTTAVSDYLQLGIGDLEGYFGIFPSEAATAAASLF